MEASSKPKFIAARRRFIEALTRYQSATRDLCLSVSRMTDQTVTVYRSLDVIAQNANTLLQRSRL